MKRRKKGGEEFNFPPPFARHTRVQEREGGWAESGKWRRKAKAQRRRGKKKKRRRIGRAREKDRERERERENKGGFSFQL